MSDGGIPGPAISQGDRASNTKTTFYYCLDKTFIQLRYLRFTCQGQSRKGGHAVSLD